MAQAKFNWIFVEPFLYLVLVFAEYKGHLTGIEANAYIAFFIMTMLRYLSLMNNI